MIVLQATAIATLAMMASCQATQRGLWTERNCALLGYNCEVLNFEDDTKLCLESDRGRARAVVEQNGKVVCRTGKLACADAHMDVRCKASHVDVVGLVTLGNGYARLMLSSSADVTSNRKSDEFRGKEEKYKSSEETAFRNTKTAIYDDGKVLENIRYDTFRLAYGVVCNCMFPSRSEQFQNRPLQACHSDAEAYVQGCVDTQTVGKCHNIMEGFAAKCGVRRTCGSQACLNKGMKIGLFAHNMQRHLEDIPGS